MHFEAEPRPDDLCGLSCAHQVRRPHRLKRKWFEPRGQLGGLAAARVVEGSVGEALRPDRLAVVVGLAMASKVDGVSPVGAWLSGPLLRSAKRSTNCPMPSLSERPATSGDH